jgi:hypothetical protein
MNPVKEILKEHSKARKEKVVDSQGIKKVIASVQDA